MAEARKTWEMHLIADPPGEDPILQVDAASAGAAAIAFLDTLGYQVVEHVPIPLSGLTCTWDGCGSAEVYGPDQDGQYECHTCFAEHTRETLTQRS